MGYYKKFDNLIKLEDIELKYQQSYIFKNLSLEISNLGISFIIGENGSGKTQILRLIHGLTLANSGIVTSPKPYKQAMLQQYPILLNRNVKDNLLFIRATKVCSSRYFDDNYDRVVNRFDLDKILYKLVSNLSGGQKKRVALARMFLQQASVYLLDEPSANIDHKSNLLIESVIKELIEKNKKVIISSHDYLQITRLFKSSRDEVLFIKEGQLNKHLKEININNLKRYF